VTQVETRPIGWLGWLWRAALAALLVVNAVGFAESVWTITTKSGFYTEDALGVAFGPSTVHEPRWLGIDRVVPGASAAAAGLRPGDSVRFDAFMGESTAWRPGERVSMLVARDRQRFPATVLAGAPEDNGTAAEVIGFMGAFLFLSAAGFGAVLLVRGWRSRVALQLATLLLLMVHRPPTLWLPHSAAAMLALLIGLSMTLIHYIWPVFCLEISGGPSSRRQGRVVVGAALLFLVPTFYNELALTLPWTLPGSGSAVGVILALLNQLTGYAVLAANYRRNDAPARNRIRIVVLAFACILLALFVSQELAVLLRAGRPVIELVSAEAGEIVLVYATLILLTYAVLRQRLFDLGFALNRTLVYGAVSFILLASFGLAEWAADHLIPESWRGASALYSAGIALILFLSFHRLRDLVERQVERLFFHHWQQSEAALRRFVAAAGHFDQSAALCGAFVEEASRFAVGAPAALYLKASDGEYRLQAGRLAEAPDAYAEDDSAYALMRAERRPVDLARSHARLAGALALPMLDQGALAGFVLVGARPDGADFRPDEVELLGWAAHQVGLDLQALHARDLQAQVVSLNETVAGLNGTVAGLSEKVAWLSEDKARLTLLLTGGLQATAGEAGL
jgi:hypothetical protein